MPFISMEHIVTMLSVALPVAASLFVFYRGFSKPCDQRRYDELVAPLFELIEPYLFKGKDYHRREVEKAMQLIAAKRSIAGGKLIDVLYHWNHKHSEYGFISLCKATSNEYDRLSRRLGIPTRSIDYRLNNRQYQSKAHYAITFIGLVAFQLSMLACAFVLFALFINMLATYTLL